MKIILIIFILLFSSLWLFPQKIDFFREDLNFRLEEDIFEVDGLYYFKNNTPDEIKQMLFYPFPDDHDYGKIRMLKISIKDDTLNQIATQSNKGALFKVKILSWDTVIYRIVYTHELLKNKAEYILTTTQKWKKPLDEANYYLSFPENILIDTISYSPDTVINKNNSTTYCWHRKNFMPDRNMIIYFKKAEK